MLPDGLAFGLAFGLALDLDLPVFSFSVDLPVFTLLGEVFLDVPTVDLAAFDFSLSSVMVGFFRGVEILILSIEWGSAGSLSILDSVYEAFRTACLSRAAAGLWINIPISACLPVLKPGGIHLKHQESRECQIVPG